MSTRFAITTFLALSLLTVTSQAQQPMQQSSWRTAAAPVAYSLQDPQENEESLHDQLKKMELRLRELENDVANRVQETQKRSVDDDKDDKSLADRIDSLEETVEEQGESVEKFDSALPGLVFHGHKNPKLQLFGRIHLDYWSFPNVDDTVDPLEGGDPQDRFLFRRMRLGVKGVLNDNMVYKYEGEFADGNDPSYRDAYLGFTDVPVFRTVLFGNQKRPYGLDHLNSSRHNVFIERPFVVEAFNQDARRLGICSYGVSEDLGWNWRFGYFNQVLTQTRAGYIGDNYQGEFAARLARTAWYDESSGGRGWAHFAISGSAGSPDGFNEPSGADYRTRPEARTSNRWLDTGLIAGANANYLIGLETAFNVGKFNFTGEYLRVNVDRQDFIGEDVAFDGYYGQVSYFLTGEHRVWDRESGTLGRVKPLENFFTIRDCDCNIQRGLGAWELSARYSYADLTDFDIVGGTGESFTFGLNWYWNAYSRMQFNYILGEVDRGAAGFGDYEIFGVRLMVDF